jgi:NAD(P)-dependent dehydrogenase (short-subunit alcohol dehydrogenase family)
MKLKNKTALVTGASTGIGFSTAKQFLAEGATVLITGNDPSRLAAATLELGARAIATQLDVRDKHSLNRLAETVRSELGHLDVLFANAGVAFATPLASTEEAQFDELMNVNVKGVFFTVQRCAPLMREGGSIILNTSWLNQIGMANLSVLSASKAAVRSFARTLSAELLPRRIRVNAVSPGAIATPIHAKTAASPEALEQTALKLASLIPLARMGTADEIAAAALFLASDDSRYMLGAEIVVDGGFSQL